MADEVQNCVVRLCEAVRSRKDEDEIRRLLTELEDSSNLAGSRLHTAVEAGGEYLVNLVNVSDGQKRRPLHYAAQWGSVPVVERLLELGADIDAAGGDSLTPLHRAVYRKNETIVNLLLDRGAQVNVLDGYRHSPLYHVAWWESVPVIERLLELGADIDAADGDSLTPLHRAVWCQNETIVNLLLDRGAQVNVLDKARSSPLHYAAQWGSVPVIERLLELGAVVDAADCISQTPLHRAVCWKNETTVNLLLDRGAQVNVLDKARSSPLHHAVEWGSVPVIERLLELGADIDAADGDSRTPLHRAVLHNKETTVNLLLDRGAQVNVLDIDRSSPLHYAVKWGSVPVIERLLKHGADVDPINSSNLTPLLIAALGRRDEAVIALLRHGAGIKAKRANRLTALHSAAQWADELVVENLIYYVADPKASDDVNRSPLHCSILNGHPEVTRILLENYAYGSDMCGFLTSVMRGSREMSQVLSLHFLDLEVRNMWAKAHSGDCCSCRSTLKDVIEGDIDGAIEMMKRRSIVEGITLYDLITKSKNQMVPLVRNTSLLEALASVDVAKDFPVFAGLFKYKWESALSRGRLIQDGVSALGSLMIASVACRVNVNDALVDALRSAGWGWMLGFLKVSPETPTADFIERLKQLDYLLPVAVVENVLSNLSDADLRNLITAAQLTN